MFKKENLGIVIFFVLLIIPIIIWAIYTPLLTRISNYSTITNSLGQLLGLVGMTLFALTFILATRLNFLEKYFGSLDKVYRLHAKIGAIAFILLLFHPILLVLKFIPGNYLQAMIYLLPSTSIAVNLGIIALLVMIVLIAITLYIQIKYSYWKVSHKILGIAFILAILHIFLIKSDISRSVILRYYMFLISVFGLIAYVYSSFIKRFTKEKYYYTVSSVDNRSKNTISIYLKPNNKEIQYKPGQFVFIRFYQKGISSELHPFSISSSPDKKELRLVIKYLGDFTKSLNDIRPGALAKIEGPYGRFNYQRHNEHPQIWIAGGVGITPFLAMADDIEHSGRLDHEIDLFYCFNTPDDAIYLERFQEISKKIKNFHVIPFCSKDRGYISSKIILEESRDAREKIFFLCGPPVMMNSLKQQLIESGIPKKNIVMEEFNFR